MARDNSIDIAKGIGIILVVYGHTFQACPIDDEILLFHMPLFFLLSGCFIKENETIQLSLYKKMRTLIIPLIIFYLISLIIKIFLYTIRGQVLSESLTNIDFYSFSKIDYPLWFLVCLFSLSVLYLLIIRFFKNRIIFHSIIILLSALGYILSINQINLPLKLTQALVVLPFMHIGKLYYIKKQKIQSRRIILFLLSILLFSIGIIYHVKTDIRALILNNNPLLFYLPALGGTFLTIFISEWIAKYNWSKILSILGVYSLFIFAIHANMGFLNSLITHSVEIIFNLVRYLNSTKIEQTALWGILKVLVSVPICLIIGIILKTYCPYLWSYSNSYQTSKNNKTNV